MALVTGGCDGGSLASGVGPGFREHRYSALEHASPEGQTPELPELPGATRVKKDFRLIDLNGTGKIDPEELCWVLQNLDPDIWTTDCVDILFSAMDQDQDGLIDYLEFVDWVFDNSDVVETCFGECDVCGTELGMKRNWYHRSNSTKDLCIVHWQKHVDRKQYALVRTDGDLGAQRAPYVRKEISASFFTPEDLDRIRVIVEKIRDECSKGIVVRNMEGGVLLGPLWGPVTVGELRSRLSPTNTAARSQLMLDAAELDDGDVVGDAFSLPETELMLVHAPRGGAAPPLLFKQNAVQSSCATDEPSVSCGVPFWSANN